MLRYERKLLLLAGLGRAQGADGDGSFVRLDQSAKYSQDGALAATGRADEAHELAGGDVQADPGQGVGDLVVAAEPF